MFPLPVSNLLVSLSTGLLLGAMALWGKYRNWWWYDNLAHAFGGAMLSPIFLPFLPWIWPYVAVVLTGFGWEYFEFVQRIHPWTGRTSEDKAYEDTLLDMFMVLTGAILAGIALSVVP